MSSRVRVPWAVPAGRRQGVPLHKHLRAASAAGFYYSEAFVTAGRDGLVWDEQTIEQLIADPERFLGGRHRMRYKAIPDPEDRRQIVMALKAATR